MYIVLLETSGNQRYIFSTNKLRENVGASELTYQIGTKIVLEAVKAETNLEIYDDNPGELRKNLSDKSKNPEISDGNKVEVIIATSGKAILLIDDDKDKTISKHIVREVTKNALIKMPGLTVHGAICEVKNNPDKNEAENLDDAVSNVHETLEKNRYQFPSNLQRFQRIPFVAQCNSSNLPAEKLYVHESIKKEEEKPHSIVSITKQENLKRGKDRLEETIRKIESDVYFAKNSNDLDRRFEDTKWFAVIHGDGNGLGRIFLKFQKHIKAKDGKEYREKYRKFSLGLDECTEKAAAFALKNLQDAYRARRKDKLKDSIEVPAIPLVLGGDDLTIICDGQYAIKFTKDFLNKFVAETKDNLKIKEVFPDGIDLGICAGIAIIKPHFPFHQAYHLAEELLQSAKKSKQISSSLSAFDYHILYDSSGTTLDEIREKTPFVARPYVVTPKDEALKDKDQTQQYWIENHHFEKLEKRVEAMTEKDDDDKNNLPNSQLHVLREGLFVADNTEKTQQEVDARAKLIAHRYDNFEKLFVEDGTLFFDAVLFDKNDNEETTKRTHFLDALDIAEFWK
ncbi:MAG TPA: hypothetical protein VGC76_12385 [Pyrinomonadaceae bacterium]|jgi:hypothetical protein